MVQLRSAFPWSKRRSRVENPVAQGAVSRNFCDVLSVVRLAEAKRAALRRGIWFRSLNRIERGILDLTVKYVDCVKSAKLAKIVSAILSKLKMAMESTVERVVRVIGVSLAQKISSIAVNWGNKSAVSWADDHDFALYLAMNFPKSLATN